MLHSYLKSLQAVIGKSNILLELGVVLLQLGVVFLGLLVQFPQAAHLPRLNYSGFLQTGSTKFGHICCQEGMQNRMGLGFGSCGVAFVVMMSTVT